MDNKNLMPQQAQPVNRIATRQQQAELMELSEETLSLRGGEVGIHPSVSEWGYPQLMLCSCDGEDAE